MNIRYRVTLTPCERDELRALLGGGRQGARKLKRAQILLAADAGIGDEDIAASVGVGGSTVYRTKRRFVEGNLERALSEESRPGAERKLSGKEEALLVATACATPPAGRARWTLDLLAGEMVKLTAHESLSRETVRRRLADADLKPWRRKMWCIPEVDADYVARMEDVLDLYAEAPDPRRPVICFDESPIQLIGEARRPIPPEPGQIERYDCEYRRNGTANLFVFLDANRPWRKVKVTERRTAIDFAVCMRELAEIHYPKAELIRVVLDNLSTHSVGAFYQAFPAEHARRLLRRIEFHYVPKHASWLNSRNRDRRPLQPMPGPSYRKPPTPRRRSRRLGEEAKCRPRPRQLELHNRKGALQNGPSLSKAHKSKAASKSQNLCAEELVKNGERRTAIG